MPSGLQEIRRIRCRDESGDPVSSTSLVTDPAVVADMAARWAAGGWPARVDDTGVALTAEFSAPSAGPPPWHVYRLTPKTATALATVEPGGATRWRF